jgi:hypothetical protein
MSSDLERALEGPPGAERQLGDASSVLLLGSMLDDLTKGFHDTLLSEDAVDEKNVLVLTHQSPDSWLRDWNERSESAGNVGIITFSESWSRRDTLPSDVSTVTVNAGDLTGIAMKLTQFLTASGECDSGTVLCFESITELLQYNEPKPLFRFLRLVTRRIDHVEGTAHFHMDPSVHDTAEISRMRSLFDAIVEPRPSTGDVTVSTRYSTG